MTFHKLIMRNVALVLLSAFFLSCEDATTSITYDIFGHSPLQTYFTDSIRVNRSTLLLDSANTSRQTQIMVGGYDDPLLGHIETASYIQFSLPLIATATGTTASNPFTLDAAAVIDSVSLRLTSSEYILGDTLKKLNFSVHRLKSSLDTTKSYNYDEYVDFDSTPLASTSINKDDIYTIKRDTVKAFYISLPKSIAEELKSIANTTNGARNDAFVSAFKGFALKANHNGNSKSLYGFTSAGGAGAVYTSMVLYYHIAGDLTPSSFIFETGSQRYTSIKSDRTGTLFSKLITKNIPLPSTQTNGITAVQVGNGLTTKFQISDISSLKGKTINSATLIFDVDSTLTTTKLQPLPLITLTELDENNKLKKDANYIPLLLTLGASAAPQPILYESVSKTYTADITNYIEALAKGTKQNNGFVILPASLNSSSSLVLSNGSVVRMPIRTAKIKIYYSTL